MWEEEPVGVDPKRPLVGFALVAVLCAVMMTLSVSRGWSVDLVHPGKPLVAPAAGPVVGPPSQAPVPSEPRELSIPAELTTQPLGVAHGGPATKKSATHATPEAEVAFEAVTETQVVTSVPEVVRSGKDARSADKAQRKADRTADKTAAKAQRQSEKTAMKALRTLQKAAAKAERKAEKAAARAQRDAEKAAAQAQREAEKAARKG